MYKVIIVDDENIVRIALRTIIDWNAYQFIIAGTASDGQEAIRLIEDNEIDLVVTDLRMPCMDGIELMEWLNKQNYKGEILIVSNYDDFELVRKGMKLGAADYLLKVEIDAEQFAKTLQKIAKKLDCRQQIGKKTMVQIVDNEEYWQILNAVILENAELEQKQGMNEIFRDKKGTLFLLHIRNFKKIFSNYLPKEMEQTYEGIENIIHESLQPDGLVRLLMKKEEKMLFFYQTSTQFEGNIFQTFEKILSLLQLYMNLEVIAIYSDWVVKPDCLKRCYEEIKETNESLFYGVEGKNLIAGRKPLKDSGKAKEYKNKAEEIADACKELNLAVVQEKLNQFCQYCKEEYIFPKQVISMLQQVMDECCQQLISMDKKWEIFPDSYNGFIQCKTLEELREIVSSYLVKLIRSCENRIEYKKEVKQIMKYIRRNINKKITLSMIAEEVSLNESYLCTIFRNDTGKSIVQYINGEKMKKAASLLLTSDRLLADIAEEVGIGDQFYFNRVFKKHYGMTPAKYKALQRGEKKDGS